jgi:uncharacterized protein with FMN-binding domain
MFRWSSPEAVQECNPRLKLNEKLQLSARASSDVQSYSLQAMVAQSGDQSGSYETLSRPGYWPELTLNIDVRNQRISHMQFVHWGFYQSPADPVTFAFVGRYSMSNV